MIFSQLEFIADFQNLCRTKRDVEKVYPDYVADYSTLVALQERLQTFKKVQSLTDVERKDIVDISMQVSKLKRKILGVKVFVDRLESVEASDSIVLAVQQFLLSFTVSVLGAVVGILGVMFGVWGFMAKCPVWGKGLVMALMLGCAAGICSWFYRWSAKRLLTEGQRRMLSEKFNISWR